MDHDARRADHGMWVFRDGGVRDSVEPRVIGSGFVSISRECSLRQGLFSEGEITPHGEGIFQAGGTR